MAQSLRIRKETEQELIWRLTLKEQSHLTVSLMKTLWQQMITIMQLESEIKFGQDHHPFIRALSGLKIQEAPHVNKDSLLIASFFASSWA
jgi:hypothetical protein